MRKSLLISTVSAIVLMSASHAFADPITVSTWADLKNAVENTGGEITLGADIEVPADGYITKYISGTVIDGNGHTISAPQSPEGTESADFRFINNKTTTDIPLEIKNVTFKGGHLISSSSAYGGAIYNSGTIGDITGLIADGVQISFKNNYAKSARASATGGAISNSGTNTKIGNIYGNFEGNYAENTTTYSPANGGAIYNYGTIGNENGGIWGDFINNHVKGADAHGGAIFNEAVIRDIHGSFEGNYAEGTDSARGGAILNYGTIGNKDGGIWGNFINNHAEGGSYVWGGAIYNGGVIGDIYGSFENNYTESRRSYTSGGAIYNSGSRAKIGSIEGSFINNHVKGVVWNSLIYRISGGAIYNHNSEIGDIIGSVIDGKQIAFKGNFVQATGEGDYASAYGGAIYNYTYNSNGVVTIGEIKGDFINNHAESKNSYAYGGAIYNQNGTIGEIEGSFLNNYVQGNEDSKGGAIYSNKDITIAAKDGRTSEFAGNYVLVGDVKTPNAVYMEAGTLNLVSTTNGQIVFEDEIDGHEGYKIFVTGDDTGHVYFNNNIRNADITLDKTNLIVDNAIYLGNNDQMTVNSGNLTINSGHMMIKDLGLNQLHFSSLSIPNGLLTIASVDVDLANQTSGQISADNVVQTRSVGDGKIEVENIRLLSDGEEGDTQIKIVSDNIAKEVTTEIKEAVAPVYKYGVSYDAATGEFTFTRGDLATPEPEEPAPDLFNQGVFASDVFMLSGLNTQDSAVKEVAAMDPNKEPCMGRVWALPFYSDDTIEYKNFYDVDSKNYGLIAGIDTRSFGDSTLSHVYTLFGAYSEGRDKYQGIKVENKSWLLGLKASVFSDNGLYGDAIIDIASHDMDADTFYGNDSHDTYGYGAALKGGHKHDIEKVNIDTSVMLSWQQVKGDDFTAASGAKMKTDDYSRLSLMPQIKVGYDLNSIRPYALVRYNFVLDEDGSSAANGTTLPEIESKNYVEYGLGVETTTNSNHSGFAHVLRHDGGREGWAITAGYKYNF